MCTGTCVFKKSLMRMDTKIKTLDVSRAAFQSVRLSTTTWCLGPALLRPPRDGGREGSSRPRPPEFNAGPLTLTHIWPWTSRLTS